MLVDSCIIYIYFNTLKPMFVSNEIQSILINVYEYYTNLNALKYFIVIIARMFDIYNGVECISSEVYPVAK